MNNELKDNLVDNEPLEYFHTEIYDSMIESNENMLLSIRNYNERVAKLLFNEKGDTNANEFKEIIINPIDDRNTYCIQALFERKNKREQIEKCLTEVTSLMETIKKNNELIQAIILKKLNDIQ